LTRKPISDRPKSPSRSHAAAASRGVSRARVGQNLSIAMNLAVLGAQWATKARENRRPAHSTLRYRARYQGGHNAGHTVYVNGTKLVLVSSRPDAARRDHA
jgi:hypothetical protein